MAEYTLWDLWQLAPQWLETFGEELAMGFDIGPDEAPIIRQCLEQKSQQPLDDHMKSLPAGIIF